ncbi:hypothetical protein [Paenibacillus eucommiae]|uniref:Uncharacterized protein n=1 Tax=Paenibacillus eucommiae TaxID=1355755 RepID=A0ABS4IMD3_9BACL|nr:hypothetical protein [Paenibacillus eucommiae]MBP1988737.1 hypothetical protein [Paenibacillus eucommiae]
MKKIAKLWMVSMILVICAACSTPEQNSGASSSPSTSATVGNETNQQNEPEAVQTANVKKAEPSPVYPTTFDTGDVLLYPNQYEISMVSTEFSTKVSPPNPGTLYSYYEVKDPDKIYVHNVFHVKNLGGTSISADEIMNVKIMYDGKYEYTGFSTIEEDGGSELSYSNITFIAPLTSGKLHFLTEVPLEVKTSGKSVEVVVTANGNSVKGTNTTSKGQTLTMGKEHPLPEQTAWQQYKPLKAAEKTVDEAYAELTILDAKFETSVKPPKASGMYSYYEVKDPGKIYAHISFAFKNLMTIGKDAEEAISVRLIYNNKYEYRGFSTIEEDNGSNFTYSNIVKIDPLSTERIHYVIEVPVEVKDSGLPVVFVIRMNETDYYYEMKP